MVADARMYKDPGLSVMFKEYGVEVIPFEEPSFVDDPLDDEEEPKPGRLGLHVLRYFLKYLEHDGMNKYKGVVLVLDAENVVFQGDPFAQDVSARQSLSRQSAVLATEGGPALGSVLVNMSRPMHMMIQDCFGTAMASRMGKLPVINGDVIIGSPYGVTQLVMLVVDVLATRTRERCLENGRADRAALQYSVGEFGRDPRNVDFSFSLRNHVTSTIFGVKHGLPAKIDSHGILRRTIPKGSVRRGPTPTIITQYSANSYLKNMYRARYKLYAHSQIDFDQRSGYEGDKLDASIQLDYI